LCTRSAAFTGAQSQSQRAVSTADIIATIALGAALVSLLVQLRERQGARRRSAS
jgi:hypothetical protein